MNRVLLIENPDVRFHDERLAWQCYYAAHTNDAQYEMLNYTEIESLAKLRAGDLAVVAAYDNEGAQFAAVAASRARALGFKLLIVVPTNSAIAPENLRNITITKRHAIKEDPAFVIKCARFMATAMAAA